MGRQNAGAELINVLAHAAMPHVSKADIEITADYYFYKAIDQAWIGGFSTVARPVTRKVMFANVQQVQVWQDDEKHYCRLMGIDVDGDRHKIDQLRWTSAQEAMAFADLVMSFKAARGR
jgi:hypothetical protein